MNGSMEPEIAVAIYLTGVFIVSAFSRRFHRAMRRRAQYRGEAVDLPPVRVYVVLTLFWPTALLLTPFVLAWMWFAGELDSPA